MATVTRRIEVCDVCRDVNKPVVTHARIAEDGGRLRTYAFCQGDYKPLSGVIEAIQRAEGEKLSGRRGGSKQVTMEQIDQIKTSRRGRKPKAQSASA
jgi:hypothetical protein